MDVLVAVGVIPSLKIGHWVVWFADDALGRFIGLITTTKT